MLVLFLFAFFAGVVTILSPCILPILPIILSSTIGGTKVDRGRPIGVVIGFVLSFTFFTLFLSTIVKASGIPADAMRTFSIIIIAGFGLSLLLPQSLVLMEKLFSGLMRYTPNVKQRSGLHGGVLLGLSLGLLWTPCVGPILASVISLALSGAVTLDALLITVAYSIGTAIPMFLIMVGGQKALQKTPWLVQHTQTIQKVFGVVMILTALGIYNNVDRQFQTYILDKFPQYGSGLTKFEDNTRVKEGLDRVMNGESPENGSGEPAPNPDFEGATKWINGESLSLNDELKGKVVLVDFWTYTCINCIRTLPYVTAWYEQYKADGLVVVGVHTPEFEFEKEEANVLKAMKDFGINYPVVQDNEFLIWNSYSNRYWPAHYLIDRKGRIRYTHFGEGEYNATEDMIRRLLKETGGTVSGDALEMPDKTPQGPRTPESYLGYARIDRFASAEKIVEDAPARYTLSPGLPTHSFALGGMWTITPEYARSAKGSELELAFEGQDVFLVMRPVVGGTPGKVEVYLDEGLVSSFAGLDVKGGVVTVDSDRLYRLIHVEDGKEHLLKLRFIDSPVEVFAFTFG